MIERNPPLRGPRRNHLLPTDRRERRSQDIHTQCNFLQLLTAMHLQSIAHIVKFEIHEKIYSLMFKKPITNKYSLKCGENAIQVCRTTKHAWHIGFSCTIFSSYANSLHPFE